MGGGERGFGAPTLSLLRSLIFEFPVTSSGKTFLLLFSLDDSMEQGTTGGEKERRIGIGFRTVVINVVGEGSGVSGSLYLSLGVLPFYRFVEWRALGVKLEPAK